MPRKTMQKQFHHLIKNILATNIWQTGNIICSLNILQIRKYLSSSLKVKEKVRYSSKSSYIQLYTDDWTLMQKHWIEYIQDLTSSLALFWKVDGSILGNNFNITGSRSSMKGTITITANGTRRNISEVVLLSCCLSLRLRLFPLPSLSSNLDEILKSVQRSFVPTQ